MVGLAKRPTVPPSLCTSAFAGGDGRSVGLVKIIVLENMAQSYANSYENIMISPT